MRIVVPRDPGVASLPRRAVAALIDALLMLGAFGTAAIAAIAAIGLLGRLGRRPAWLDRDTRPDVSRLQRWEFPLTIVSAALAPIGRNWRTPGMRIAGIRPADARTGGPVQPHSAIVQVAADAAIAKLHRRLRRTKMEDYERRRLAANEKIERLWKSDPDADRWEALERSKQIQREYRIGCRPLAMRGIARLIVFKLPALWSSRRQTPSQRLAGTIILDDR
jgi:hypothetical protein